MGGPLSDADLTIFKDLTGLHEFTEQELVALHRMAEEAKKILSASKRREQEKFAKQGR